jgi:hypothetical protein
MPSTDALAVVRTPPLAALDAPLSSSEQPPSAERLGEAIAELAARLHAATYELLALLREFDERAGWNGGFMSCAHWLHWRTGIDLGAAREKVRVAKALPALPLISAAMQRGVISYAKVRALTRVATPENEAPLLDLALAGTAAHVERFVRAWRRVDRVEDPREAEAQHLRRALSIWVDDDGMVVIRGRLTPEVGAVVQRALEAAADRLFREAADAPAGGAMAEEMTAGQRRADALGLVAEAALSADLDRGSAGDRYQIVLHVDASGPASAVSAPPVDASAPNADTYPFSDTLDIADGATSVSAETSRRLACDAAVVVMRHDAGGTVLDVGRKTRTIPPAIRRALEARDPGCRFPGCTARRCDAHHVVHWVDGGATRLENLVRLCRRHHRAVHEGGFSVTVQLDGALAFFRPDGRRFEAAPALPRWDPASERPPVAVDASSTNASQTERPAAVGITIGPRSVAVWDGTPFDLAWAIDVVRPTCGRNQGSGGRAA